jgi:hypothetical protein
MATIHYYKALHFDGLDDGELLDDGDSEGLLLGQLDDTFVSIDVVTVSEVALMAVELDLLEVASWVVELD